MTAPGILTRGRKAGGAHLDRGDVEWALRFGSVTVHQGWAEKRNRGEPEAGDD